MGHFTQAQAVTGNRRTQRHPQGWRRLEWVRSLRRARRAIDACAGLIGASLQTAAASERCCTERPIRSSRDLHRASGRLVDASARLNSAARALARTNECVARDPERAMLAPELLIFETHRWISVAAELQAAAGEVFGLQKQVLGGLASGTLVPEPETDRRPRLVLTPRPAPVRAFLRIRLPRVSHRIAPILRRRRRTPRPAALKVPRRSVLGRAPPLSPVCSL